MPAELPRNAVLQLLRERLAHERHGPCRVLLVRLLTDVGMEAHVWADAVRGDLVTEVWKRQREGRSGMAPTHRRRRASRAIGCGWNPRQLVRLGPAARDPTLAAAVLHGLAQLVARHDLVLDSEPVPALLTAMLEARSHQLRAMALRLLPWLPPAATSAAGGSLTAPSTTAVLRRFLADPDPRVREARARRPRKRDHGRP